MFLLPLNMFPNRPLLVVNIEIYFFLRFVWLTAKRMHKDNRSKQSHRESV